MLRMDGEASQGVQERPQKEECHCKGDTVYRKYQFPFRNRSHSDLLCFPQAAVLKRDKFRSQIEESALVDEEGVPR
jgi:hypothetical protein